jgi:membrane protein implicated in regulation of membrane protease activity
MTRMTSVRPSRKTASLIFGSGLGLVSMAAEAYVGPGAGITLLSALWAVLLAVVLALGGLLIWPVRALRRRLRQRKALGETELNRQAQEP